MALLNSILFFPYVSWGTDPLLAGRNYFRIKNAPILNYFYIQNGLIIREDYSAGFTLHLTQFQEPTQSQGENNHDVTVSCYFNYPNFDNGYWASLQWYNLTDNVLITEYDISNNDGAYYETGNFLNGLPLLHYAGKTISLTAILHYNSALGEDIQPLQRSQTISF